MLSYEEIDSSGVCCMFVARSENVISDGSADSYFSRSMMVI